MSNEIYRYNAALSPAFPETSGDERIIDLGIIEGDRYLSATDQIIFPEAFEALDLTTEEGSVLKEKIRSKSPVCLTIDAEIVRKIRKKYTLNDELKALRIGNAEYNSFVEEIVAEGKQQKDDLGI
ncbi:MAG: hypothetical protein ACTSXQ_06040 [Alphaproteobacteria bacterium]